MGYKCELVDGFDINRKLIEFAIKEKETAGYDNLNYLVADLNSLKLKKSFYDLVIFFHSLHHVKNLEFVIAEAKNSLKSDGKLLVVEYVGPDRMQWPEIVVDIAQEFLEIIPKRLRVDLSTSSKNVKYKEKIKKFSIEEIINFDPSESIRSSEILKVIYKEFQVLEEKPRGGTIIDLIFEGIAGNFNENDEMEYALILLLQKIEELFIRYKVIIPHYTFLVAKK